MAKTREYECPNCGEFEEVYNASGPKIDFSETDGDIYEIISITRKCYKCGAKWTEYMRLMYDGYYDGANIYDKNGIKAKD